MSKYKVTIKVTETYTYETDEAVDSEDAIAHAFRERCFWSYEYDHDEYSAIVEPQEQEVDE